MLRVSLKATPQYPWHVRLLFWLQRRKYGKILEPTKAWGMVPGLLWGISLLFGTLDRKKSPIDPVLRALISVRVSQINQCTFCVDINSATVLKRGGALEKLEHLPHFRESPLFSPAEKIALAYAETITITGREVTDEIWDELKKYFDEKALIELIGLIAFQNLSSKFNHALDIPPQEFCNLPNHRDR